MPPAKGEAGAAAGAPVDTLCMGCSSAACDFKPLRLQRRPLGEGDVLIDMKFCGICHSDGALRLCGMGATRLRGNPCNAAPDAAPGAAPGAVALRPWQPWPRCVLAVGGVRRDRSGRWRSARGAAPPRIAVQGSAMLAH
jgi:hypothetical protein